jgi:hypothetical protein
MGHVLNGAYVLIAIYHTLLSGWFSHQIIIDYRVTVGTESTVFLQVLSSLKSFHETFPEEDNMLGGLTNPKQLPVVKSREHPLSVYHTLAGYSDDVDLFPFDLVFYDLKNNVA